MKLTGTYSIDAKQQTVWYVLMNPQAIANALPGVNELVPVEGEENTWNAVAKIGFAAVSGTYTGSIHMSDITPTDSYRLTVNGKGQQSIIDGTVLIELVYKEETQQTDINWDADAKISGKLARVGQRVFKAAATSMSNTFFENLAAQIPEEEADEESIATATLAYEKPSFAASIMQIIRRFFAAFRSSS